MQKRLRDLFLSHTFKDTGKIFAGNIFSSLLAICFFVLAARALGPGNFGIFSSVVALSSIFIAIGDFGLGSALFRFVSAELENTKKSRKILEFLFGLRIGSAITFLIILLVFSPLISIVVFGEINMFYVFISIINAFFFLIVDFEIQKYQSRRQFKSASIYLVLVNFFRVLGLVLLMLIKIADYKYFLALYALSSGVTFCFLYFVEPIQLRLGSDWKVKLRDVFRFSGWMGLNKLLSSIGSRIDVILIYRILTPHETGIYSASKQLSFGIPLFVGSFATVIAPRFSSISEKDLYLYLKKTISLSVLICFGLIFGIIVSPFIIGLFGSEYARSLTVLRILLFSYIPFVLSTPAVNYIIYALKKPRVIFYITLLNVFVVVLGNMFFLPRFGVIGSSYLQVFANTVLFFFSNVYLFSKIKI